MKIIKRDYRDIIFQLGLINQPQIRSAINICLTDTYDSYPALEDQRVPYAIRGCFDKNRCSWIELIFYTGAGSCVFSTSVP